MWMDEYAECLKEKEIRGSRNSDELNLDGISEECVRSRC